MAIKATKIADNPGGFAGDHALYQLDKPLTDPGDGKAYDTVVVFCTNHGNRPETIIVPGASQRMTRLPGSMVGIADHAGALWAAGGFAHGEPYEIVEAD